MSVNFIGYVGYHNSSETIPRSGPILDKDFVAKAARVQEEAGFERVLLYFTSTHPDDVVTGQYIASVTDKLKLMIAHRPGFYAPTVAARQFATLDHLFPGRIAVHVITGGDEETVRDGDHLSKDERYNRTREYVDVLRLVWGSEKPFSYQGRHYSLPDAYSEIRPATSAGIPIYFGGASQAAVEVAGRHADVYALFGQTYAQVAEMVERVKAAAAAHGRSPGFSLSFRPILGKTEEAAWAKADAILARAGELLVARGVPTISGLVPKDMRALPSNEGSRRLLAAAEKGSRLDKCLWTGMAALTGAMANTMCLVGTPEQVADTLVDYYRLGVGNFLIRGFDPIEDARQYGRELIPLVKARVAAEKIAQSPAPAGQAAGAA